MSLTEIIGFITGAACVWLQAKENIWNWPLGIANNIFFLVLFWQSKLYADAGLQVFYIAISIYGWWDWAYGGEGRTELPVRRTPRLERALIAIATVAATGVLFWILRRFTDSTVPAGDAITTALSLAAQYMLSRKYLENWIVWIVADVIYIGLYCYKHLYLTAFLYVVFIAMCVVGYQRWQRSLGGAPANAAESPAD